MNQYTDAARIVVLNCGSSSIKFAVFDAVDPLPFTPLWSGKVQGIGGKTPKFDETGVSAFAIDLDEDKPYRSALALIRQRLLARLKGARILAVAHRVVHGGSQYFKPVLLNERVLADLRELIPLAPLHQPFALEAIEILLQEQPELPQVACFDTGFHHTLPKVEQQLPLSQSAWERGLRRYGFHGLSYEYMASILPQRYGERAQGRVIVAHLGSGASLCALHHLQSVATTMGFSALDGLMMGTRTGAVDPGALLYLLEIEKHSVQDVAHMLYHQSGLLGVSGLSADVQVLLRAESHHTGASEALALYVRRIIREIGAMVAVLGGLDMLVFTAGVGENSADIRERVCNQLRFLQLELDESANQQQTAGFISTDASPIAVVVEPTNEEWVAANQALTKVIAVK